MFLHICCSHDLYFCDRRQESGWNSILENSHGLDSNLDKQPVGPTAQRVCSIGIAFGLDKRDEDGSLGGSVAHLGMQSSMRILNLDGSSTHVPNSRTSPARVASSISTSTCSAIGHHNNLLPEVDLVPIREHRLCQIMEHLLCWE